MALHLRRSSEAFLQYTVVNDAGYKVGIIRDASHHVTGPDVWEWYINGEAAVGRLVCASGNAPRLDQAKTDLAKNWRRWLELKGLPEDHRPTFGVTLWEAKSGR